MKRNNNSSVSGIIAVLITAVALIMAWKVILPGYVANRAESARLDKMITAAQDKKDSLDAAKSDLESMDDAYRSITIAVPGDADEPNTISELEAIATKNQLAIPSITISALDTVNNTAEGDGSGELTSIQAGIPVEISITVNGTFEQLSGLITSLEKSVKFMNIKNMSFAMGEGNIIGLSLSIESYARSSAISETAVE